MDGFKFPEIPSFKMPEIEAIQVDTPLQHMWADEQFEILKKYITAFEETLDDEHEVGMMLTNFGQSILMQVTNITYEEPVLFVFKGYVNEKESTLIQHMNQLNFLLTSVDKEPERPKRRIGFAVSEDQ